MADWPGFQEIGDDELVDPWNLNNVAMKPALRNWLIGLSVLAFLPVALAQRPPARQVVRVPDDVVKLKELADGGNLHAQLALAKKYSAYERHADAFDSYFKAAETGSLDAIYQVGHMLLMGAGSSQEGQKVDPNPEEAVKWIFRAATNLHGAACLDMSFALQRGMGLRANQAEAYAWMILYAARDPSRGPTALESLGLRLKTQVLLEGKQLASQYEKGQWPTLQFAAPAVRANLPLSLTGITMGGRTPLAVINRRTLSTGETTNIPLESGGKLVLKVVEIRADSVLVEIVGENQPRWLYFDRGLTAAKS